MKDFYDLDWLSRNLEFDHALLSLAIRTTFERRGTALPEILPVALTKLFTQDGHRIVFWNDADREFSDLIAVREVVARRMDGHWASGNLPSTHETPRIAFRAAYLALMAAADFLELRRAHADGFQETDADRLWQAYAGDLYRFDQLYRHFCEHADVVEAQTLSRWRPRPNSCASSMPT